MMAASLVSLLQASSEVEGGRSDAAKNSDSFKLLEKHSDDENQLAVEAEGKKAETTLVSEEDEASIRDISPSEARAMAQKKLEEILSKLSENEHESVMKCAQQMIGDTNKIAVSYLVDVVDFLSKVPVQERESLVRDTQNLMKILEKIILYASYRSDDQLNTMRYNVLEFAEILFAVPVDERKSFIEYVQGFIVDHFIHDGGVKLAQMLVKTLSTIPAIDRKSFSYDASNINTFLYDSAGRVLVIEAFAKVPAEERRLRVIYMWEAHSSYHSEKDTLRSILFALERPLSEKEKASIRYYPKNEINKDDRLLKYLYNSERNHNEMQAARRFNEQRSGKGK